jgi:hypothetical protein
MFLPKRIWMFFRMVSSLSLFMEIMSWKPKSPKTYETYVSTSPDWQDAGQDAGQLRQCESHASSPATSIFWAAMAAACSYGAGSRYRWNCPAACVGSGVEEELLHRALHNALQRGLGLAETSRCVRLQRVAPSKRLAELMASCWCRCQCGLVCAASFRISRRPAWRHP